MKKTLTLLMFACAAMLRADDWPQWRGANRDGVWRETGIVETIPPSGLDVRWRAKIGQGYSGPVVAQGRVFVTDHVFEPELERVLCFDEATGKQLWVRSYAVDYKDMEYGNGPRASPAAHDGKVWTFGTQGHLFCLDAATGAVVWQKNVAKDFNGTIPRYGVSAAPLVVSDLLIVCAGGQPDASVVALDRNTGELRWKALADRAAYSAPILINAGGREQLIVWTADSITAFDAPTGKVLWQVPRKSNFDPAEVVAVPVLHKDMLLCMGAWSRGSVMLKLDTANPGASVLWQTGSKPTTMISTPLFRDDEHFYAILGSGRLACLDAAGKEVWTSKEPTGPRSGTAHLTPNGDRVFLFNDTGHLILARLTRDGYRELGRALLVEPTAGYRAQGPLTWAHPAYANKCVFARNDRELVCASLAAKDQNPAVVAPASDYPSRVPAGFPTASSALAISPDGRALAVGGSSAEPTKVREIATGRELPAPPPLGEFLCALAYSPDGRWIVIAGGTEFTPARLGRKTQGQVKLFDVAAGKERGELKRHTNKVFAAAFAPDSKTLATGSADHTVCLWNVETMNERLVLQGHAGAVMSVAFSADGKTIASASADRTVRLWDTSSGKPLGTITGHEDEVRAVAFSPDGKTLVTGSTDWTARLWDPATQKERAVLKGHRGGVLCLAFSADGKTLATGSGDETVKLWDVATAKERATLRGHRSGISAVAFSPDDRTLASAGMNDQTRLWALADKSWRALPLITDEKIDSAWAQVGWDGFVVDDGALRTECDDRGMGLLLYKAEKFGNCQLRVVYRCEKPKSNAGVYVRLDDGILSRVGEKSPDVHRDAKGKLSPEMIDRLKDASQKHLGAWYPVHHGYEVQIMDATDAFHRTGAIYSLAKSEPVPAKPQTDWRTMIITLDGERIRVEVDGKQLSAFDSTAADLPPRVKWAEPIREIKRPTVGYIGLQNHDPGDVVWFKEVSVRPLNGAH